MVAHASLRRTLPLACLSFATAAVLDVMGTGAPLALHASGLSLADSGWLQAIYLPTGFGFLWAPVIDHRRTMGPRACKRLVLGSLLVGSAGLALLGIAWPLSVLVGLAFAASIAASMSDLASEALVIDTMPPECRGWLVTTRLIASSAGSSAGVAAATVAPGWSLQAVCVAVAVGAALLALTMLAYPETTALAALEMSCGRPSRKHLAGKAAVLSTYSVAAILLTSSQGLALLDVGVGLRIVGIVSGIATTLATMVAMIAPAALSVRAPLARQIAWCTSAVGVAAAVLVVAMLARLPLLSAGTMLLMVTCDAGLNVPFTRLMYRWSEGPRPAADFAVLSSAVFLVSFPARLVGPALAAMIGWPVYITIGLTIYLAAGAALYRSVMLK